MRQKRPRGRPKLPEGAGKETKLQVRLLRSEEEEIETAAAHAGKTKSQFVRETVLGAVRGRNQKRKRKKGTVSILTEIGVSPSDAPGQQAEPIAQQPLISEEKEQEFID